MKLFTILFFTLAFLAMPIQGQVATTPVDSLNNNLFKMSNKYTESGTIYRVVKWEVLSAYFDDIKSLDQDKSSQLDDYVRDIADLTAGLTAEQRSYRELQAKYNHSIKVNDAMVFFTLLIPKGQYNLIMWGLVCILIAVLFILSLMFNRRSHTTRQAKNELEEKIEEYDAYRKRTLKREQEVASSYLRDIKNLKEKLGNL